MLKLNFFFGGGGERPNSAMLKICNLPSYYNILKALFNFLAFHAFPMGYKCTSATNWPVQEIVGGVMDYTLVKNEQLTSSPGRRRGFSNRPVWEILGGWRSQPFRATIWNKTDNENSPTDHPGGPRRGLTITVRQGSLMVLVPGGCRRGLRSPSGRSLTVLVREVLDGVDGPSPVGSL